MLLVRSLCLLASLQPVWSSLLLDYSAAAGDDQDVLGKLNLEAAQGEKISSNQPDLYIKPDNDPSGVPCLHFHRDAGNRRAEYHALPDKTSADQTYYIGYKFSLGTIENDLMVFQFKAFSGNNADGGNANIPLSLEFKSGVLNFQYQADYSSKRVSQWSQALKTNTVYSFGIVINTSSSGWVELYFNGEQQTFSTSGTTQLPANTWLGTNEPKFGAYRGEDVEIDSYVYNIQIGTELSDIAESSGVGSSGGGGGGDDGGDGGSTTCSWEGHCEGAACSSEDDCSDDLVCSGGICSTDADTDVECTWEGHCEGATCTTYDDCADNLDCVSGTCTTP